MMRRLVPGGVLCAIVLSLWAAGPAHAAMAVIPIDHLEGQFVLPIARALLSPEGRVSFDQRTRALVVSDREAAIARVRDMLARLDRPAPQLMVRARTHRPESQRQSAGGVSGRLPVPGGSVSVGGNAPDDGLQVARQDRERSVSAGGEQRIRVASGSAAIIFMGSQIPVRTYGSQPADDGYRLSASGLEVTPELRGDLVFVRVAASDAAGTGRPPAAATQLRLPLGRWVEVGAILSETDRSVAAIVSRARGAPGGETGFWLRVDRAGP